MSYFLFLLIRDKQTFSKMYFLKQGSGAAPLLQLDTSLVSFLITSFVHQNQMTWSVPGSFKDPEKSGAPKTVAAPGWLINLYDYFFLLLSGSSVSPSPSNFLLYGPGYGYSNCWALKKGHRGNLATRECQWKTMHACSHRRIWFLLSTEMWVTQMTEWRMNQYRKCSLAKPCVWPRETAINKAPLCDSSSLSSALSPPPPFLSLSPLIHNCWSHSKKPLTYLQSPTELRCIIKMHLWKKKKKKVTLKSPVSSSSGKHVPGQRCGTFEGTKRK